MARFLPTARIKTVLTSNRTFGIELEVHLPHGRSHAQLAAAISRAGVSCRSEHYNHNTVAHWKVTTDGSLGYEGGAEVVSPVLSGEAGIIEARQVADAIKAFGCTVSVRCGFHVHVGAADLTVNQLRNVAILYVFCETAFDAIMPPSRRRDLNTYILSNRTAFGGSYDNEAVNRAIAAYKAATTKGQLIEIVSGANRCSGRDHVARYRKLNFHPLNRYGTVEFRQHSGTVEADKVANWVELCVRLVDRALTGKPRSRPSTRPHNPANELNMLLSYVRVPPTVKRFYQQRRRDLCDARLARAAHQARAAGREYQAPAE